MNSKPWETPDRLEESGVFCIPDVWSFSFPATRETSLGPSVHVSVFFTLCLGITARKHPCVSFFLFPFPPPACLAGLTCPSCSPLSSGPLQPELSPPWAHGACADYTATSASGLLVPAQNAVACLPAIKTFPLLLCATSCSFLGQGGAFPSIAPFTTEKLCKLLYRALFTFCVMHRAKSLSYVSFDNTNEERKRQLKHLEHFCLPV